MRFRYLIIWTAQRCVTGEYHMGPIDSTLERLGIKLPAAPKPVAAYVPFVRSRGGPLVFVSGQLPFKDGQLLATGPTPSVVSADKATEAARQCAINALAVLR